MVFPNTSSSEINNTQFDLYLNLGNQFITFLFSFKVSRRSNELTNSSSNTNEELSIDSKILKNFQEHFHLLVGKKRKEATFQNYNL